LLIASWVAYEKSHNNQTSKRYEYSKHLVLRKEPHGGLSILIKSEAHVEIPCVYWVWHFTIGIYMHNKINNMKGPIKK
jgi:hypothetical protein